MIDLNDVLRHLKPDTIASIINDLTEAEHNNWFSSESKPNGATLQVRDTCVNYMQTEWAALEYEFGQTNQSARV